MSSRPRARQLEKLKFLAVKAVDEEEVKCIRSRMEVQPCVILYIPQHHIENRPVDVLLGTKKPPLSPSTYFGGPGILYARVAPRRVASEREKVSFSRTKVCITLKSSTVTCRFSDFTPYFKRRTTIFQARVFGADFESVDKAPPRRPLPSEDIDQYSGFICETYAAPYNYRKVSSTDDPLSRTEK